MRSIRHLDRPAESEGDSVEIVPLPARRSGHGAATWSRPIGAIWAGWPGSTGLRGTERRRPGAAATPFVPRRSTSSTFQHKGIELVSYLFQGEGGDAAAAGQSPPSPPPENQRLNRLQGPERLRQLQRELTGNVEIETLPDLDVIILRGRERDVEEVRRIIEEIERLSAETQPVIEVYPLRHVGDESLLRRSSSRSRRICLTGRQGPGEHQPLVKPNALLLIGWGEAVKAVKELIAKLDQPVEPKTQQRVSACATPRRPRSGTHAQDFFSGRTGGSRRHVRRGGSAHQRADRPRPRRATWPRWSC